MNIVLTPTKLNGTITARPSVSCAYLHAVAQELAILGQPRGKKGSADSRVVDKFIQEPAFWSSDLELTDLAFQALPVEDGVIDVKNSRRTLHLLLPIASALRQQTSFVGSGELADNRVLPRTDVLHRRGSAFQRGKLKIKRRDRGKFEEIITQTGRIGFGHYALT